MSESEKVISPQEKNKKAMECFKTGNNRQYYSIAYKRYRNEILKGKLNRISDCGTGSYHSAGALE